MLCNDFIKQLDALLDGELSHSEQAQCLAHIQICPECAKRYQDQQAILAQCADLAELPAPPELLARVMEEAKKAKPQRARWPVAAKVITSVAAGLIVLCVSATALLSGALSLGYSSMPQTNGSVSYKYSAVGASNDFDAVKAEIATAASEPMAAPVPAPTSMPPFADTMMADTALTNEITRSIPEDGANSAEHGHKIITNGDLSLTSTSFDSDSEAILKAVAQAGGYMQNSSTSGQPISETGYSYGRNLSCTARIPSQQYDQVVAALKQLGKVTYYSEYSDDVTSDYYDTQARLEAYQKQYDTIEALLDKAETLEDVMSIQAKLSDLQYSIDSLTGTLKRWDFLVSYSTLNIHIEEVRDQTQVKPVDPTLGERIKEGFVGSINGLVQFFQDTLVWLVSSIFVLIFLALAILLVIFLIRRHRAKKSK